MLKPRSRMLDIVCRVGEVETEFELRQNKNRGFARVLLFEKELDCVVRPDDAAQESDWNNDDLVDPVALSRRFVACWSTPASEIGRPGGGKRGRSRGRGYPWYRLSPECPNGIPCLQALPVPPRQVS